MFMLFFRSTKKGPALRQALFNWMIPVQAVILALSGSSSVIGMIGWSAEAQNLHSQNPGAKPQPTIPERGEYVPDYRNGVNDIIPIFKIKKIIDLIL
jgi:hypothetical protein